ncbi:hypothetical protein QJS66_03550 [Kocuria rhizophila]|nr:hypothetical protein QJS66_03550 [Kocuria rhizophila]
MEVGAGRGHAQPGNPRPPVPARAGPAPWSTGWAGQTTEPRRSPPAWRLRCRAWRRRRPRPGGVVPSSGEHRPPKAVELSTPPRTTCARASCAPYADYLVVNVSSPNTPGCVSSRSSTPSGRCCVPCAPRRDRVTSRRVPLLVKIAPDLADEDVLAVADLAMDLGLDGIVAADTTITRDGWD